MPDLQLNCDCGRASTAPDRWALRKVACPGCGAVLTVPAPPPPPPPVWKLSWWQRRRLRRLDVEAPETTPSVVPEGLRVAVPPIPPEVLAAQRRRRRWRWGIAIGVVVVLAGTVIGGRIAWRNYRRSLYGGLDPVRVERAERWGRLNKLAGETRAFWRRLEGRRVSAPLTEEAVARSTDLLSELEAAKAFPAQQATVANNLAWLHLTTPLSRFRDPERALELARRAVELHPDPNFYDTLAEAQFQNGLYDEALASAQAAVTFLPPPPDIRAPYLATKRTSRRQDWVWSLWDTHDRIEGALLVR